LDKECVWLVIKKKSAMKHGNMNVLVQKDNFVAARIPNKLKVSDIMFHTYLLFGVSSPISSTGKIFLHKGDRT